MNQIDVPALSKADPDANVTDLLVERVAATPDSPLFALPTSDGGWSHVTAPRVPLPGHRSGERLGRRRHRARRQDRDDVQDPLRVDADRLRDLVRRRGARADLRDQRLPRRFSGTCPTREPIAIFTETPEHFARFDEVRADVPAVSRAWKIDLGDLDKLVASGKDVKDEEIERRRNLRQGRRPRDPDLHLGHDGTAEGLHPHALQLRRDLAQCQARDPRGREPGVDDAALHHARPRLRPLHLGAVHRRRRHGRPPGGHQAARPVDAGSFGPTFLLAVPRVFEKVYNSSEQKAEAGGKGKIFRKAVDVAIAHSKALDAGHVPGRLAHPLSRSSTVWCSARSRPPSGATSSTRFPALRRSACASVTSTAAWTSRSSRATASPRPPRRYR